MFIIIYILSNLQTIHKGAVISKLKSSFILGLIAAPVVGIFEDFKIWFIGNIIYFIIILSAVFFDFFIGIYTHFFLFKDFSLKLMAEGFLRKLFLTTMAVIGFELIKALFTHYNLELYDSVKLTVALIVLMYPLGSGLGNMSVATGGVIPPGKWLDKINKFQVNPSAVNLDTLDKRKNE